jgi:hypothetical protein
MKTLQRDEAQRLFSRYWDDMQVEWFKIEILQDYSGEDESASLNAWLEGDKQMSLELLKQTTHHGFSEQCKQKHDQDVILRRIRIIEKPYTPYTEWELAFYKYINIPNGEQVFLIDRGAVKGLVLPKGDLIMFDNKRVVIAAYDEAGRMTYEVFYDEHDDINQFLQLKHDLLLRTHRRQGIIKT